MGLHAPRLSTRAPRWRGGVAGEQHEDLGRVDEGEAVQGPRAHRVVRRVVHEDHPQRQAAEEVDPQVPTRPSLN